MIVWRTNRELPSRRGRACRNSSKRPAKEVWFLLENDLSGELAAFFAVDFELGKGAWDIHLLVFCPGGCFAVAVLAELCVFVELHE